MKWASVRLAGAAALLCALSSAAVAQDNNSNTSPNAPYAGANSLTDLVFQHEQDDWKEGRVAALPALPSDRDLLSFSVSNATSLDYKLDSKSISIGKDGVVRYTVVITSSSGTKNIRYEGIRCASYTWRLYSGANSDGTAWDNASTDWARIENSDFNGYHAELYNDYLCDNKAPVARVSTIVNDMKYGRTVRDSQYKD